MRKTFAVFIACVMFCVTAVISFSCEPSPYLIEVDNGNKIFVMIPNGEVYNGFEKSGLYINQEPYEVVYFIDEYFYWIEKKSISDNIIVVYSSCSDIHLGKSLFFNVSTGQLVSKTTIIIYIITALVVIICTIMFIILFIRKRKKKCKIPQE